MQPGAVSHIGSRKVPVSWGTHKDTHVYLLKVRVAAVPRPRLSLESDQGIPQEPDCLGRAKTHGESPGTNLETAVQKQSRRISNELAREDLGMS